MSKDEVADQIRVSIQRVAVRIRDFQLGVHYRDQEGGFIRHTEQPKAIFDSSGKQWTVGPPGLVFTEVAPGIEIRAERGSTRSGDYQFAPRCTLRIHRVACPVTLFVCHIEEVEYYEHGRWSTSSESWEMIQYEAHFHSELDRVGTADP